MHNVLVWTPADIVSLAILGVIVLGLVTVIVYGIVLDTIAKVKEKFKHGK